MPRFDPPMVLTEKQEVSHTSLHPQYLKAFPTPSSSSSVPPARLQHLHKSRRLPSTASAGKKGAVWFWESGCLGSKENYSERPPTPFKHNPRLY